MPQSDIEDNVLEGFQIELMDQFFLRPSIALIMFCAPKPEPNEATTANGRADARTNYNNLSQANYILTALG